MFVRDELTTSGRAALANFAVPDCGKRAAPIASRAVHTPQQKSTSMSSKASKLESLHMLLIAASLLSACGGGGTEQQDVVIDGTVAPESAFEVSAPSEDVAGRRRFAPWRNPRQPVTKPPAPAPSPDAVPTPEAPIAAPAPAPVASPAPAPAANPAPAPVTAPRPSPVTPPAPAPLPAPAIESVPTLSSVSAESPLSQLGGTVQVCNWYPKLSTLREPGYSNCPGSVLGSPLRFGRVADPKDPNRMVFRHAVKISDPQTAGNVQRVDVVPAAGNLPKDTVYWAAMEVLVPANTFYANDASSLAVIHVGGACCSGNWGLQLNRGKFTIAKTWDLGEGAGEENKWFVPTTQPQADQWNKVVVQWKPNHTGANGAFLRVWINGVQVLDDTGPNTVPGGGDYPKFGYYNWSWGNGAGDYTRPEREVFFRSYHLIKDAGYTLEKVTALLK